MLEGGGAEFYPATAPTSIEIKPNKVGYLRDSLASNERTKSDGKLDYLMVFGQGPVLNSETKQKPEPGQADITETAISWMKNAARAAGELYLEGATDKIILTGGKTGGSDYKSEAELMMQILVDEYNVPKESIVLDHEAKNTLENIPLSLNKIDKDNPLRKERPKIGLLGADFHIPRIRTLADIFDIGDAKTFSSEQIFRTIAYKLEATDDPNNIIEARTLHRQLDALLSMNDDLSLPDSRFKPSTSVKDFQQQARESTTSRSTKLSPTLFEKQQGKEKEGFVEKRQLESYFSRGMIDVPEFWFGYIKFLNDNRLAKVIESADGNLLDRFGINKNMPLSEIREKLEPYTNGDEKTGGKRRMLETHYNIDPQSKSATQEKIEVGQGRDKEAAKAHDSLTEIAARLNKLANKK